VNSESVREISLPDFRNAVYVRFLILFKVPRYSGGTEPRPMNAWQSQNDIFIDLPVNLFQNNF
jgi:hypothetical protein